MSNKIMPFFTVALLLVLVIPTIASAIPIPRAYFSFDGGDLNSSETTTDSLEPLGTGTVTLGPGHILQARFANGSQYLGATTDFNPVQANKSYTGWVYINSSQDVSAISIRFLENTPGGANGAETIALNDSNYLWVIFGNGASDTNVYSASPLSNDTWHFWGVVLDGTQNRMLLYIDGVLSTNASYTYGGSHGARNYLFARSDSSFPFVGGIDEFYVFNTTLSQRDITELYNGGQTNTSNFPYQVTQVDTFKNEAITRITAGFNSTDFGLSDFYYDYGVICDVTQRAFWNEQFKPGYNGDYITSLSNLSALLTNNGLSISIPTNVSSFFYEKAVNLGQRAESSLVLSYTNIGNMSVDLVGLTSASDPMFYYRFNRTGSNLSVYRVGVGGDASFISTTAGTDNILVEVQLSPVTQTVLGSVLRSYNIVLRVNNVTVGTDDPISINNENWDAGNNGNIADVQVFTNSAGQLYLRSLAFYQNPSTTPSTTQFVNSQVTYSGALVYFTPAQAYDNETVNNLRIHGDGYNVIPGWVTNLTPSGFLYSQTPLYNIIISSILGAGGAYLANIQPTDTLYGGNNVFFSECQYNAPGTYRQRHLLKSGAYVDLNVVVSNRTTGNTGLPSIFDPEAPAQGAISGSGNNDAIEGLFSSVLGSLGISSTSGKLFFWVLICLIFAAGTFMLHWIFGIGTFVLMMIVGVVLGLVPLWIILIFVIICAGLAAAAYRSQVAGS